jgi:hypothetical protein
MKVVMAPNNRVRLTVIPIAAILVVANFGCGGSSSSNTPLLGITVSVSPASATVQPAGTQAFIATVANDTANRGVTWTLSCSVAPCGTVSPTSTASGTATTYTAPSTPGANNLTVTLTATAVADGTKSASATITIGIPGTAVSVVGFVSESSLNNTQFIYVNSTALGVNPSGQTACPNYSYCVPFAGKTLSGNLAILPYTYAYSAAVTTTAADGGGDSFTCVDGAVDSTTTIGSNYHPHNGLCYAANSAANSVRGVVTFGTTPVTNVAADASQWYNVATSGPVDVSGSAAGISSTTANAVSVTTTTNGDLIYVHICRTGTPSTTSFTAGAGFTLLTTDIQDGCATEYQIQATAGAITPTLMMATASTYVEQVFAFKAAASPGAGTAPSGTYMERMMSWSMPQNQSAANWTFQLPSAGNLLFQGMSCGNLTPSSSVPTDSVNTWSLAGINNTSNPPVINGEYYAQNASPNYTGSSPGMITDHFTGTGDCTVKFYSFAGAPASPFTQWSQYGFSTSTSPAMVTNTWNPGANPSLWIFTGGQTNNTGTGVTTPASGCQWTGGSFGGMNINGPEPIDENNMWAVCYEATTGNQTFAYSFAGTNSNGQAADLAAFKTEASAPIVATTAASNITNTMATAGGNVTGHLHLEH